MIRFLLLKPSVDYQKSEGHKSVTFDFIVLYYHRLLYGKRSTLKNKNLHKKETKTNCKILFLLILDKYILNPIVKTALFYTQN